MTIKALYPTINPTLNLDFANTKTLGPLVTFTRASSATYVGSDGLLKTETTDEPRFDHSPTTGESLGLLVEEQRTNLMLQSQDFSTTWTNSGSSENTNVAAAPDGTQTADALVDTAVSETHDLRQAVSGLAGSTAYTVSCFMKKGSKNYGALVFTPSSSWAAGAGASVFFDLNNGTVGAASNATGTIQAFPNGWYRCTATATTAATPGTVTMRIGSSLSGAAQTYTGSADEAIYLWGAQLEAGAFPTSYIPTTTAAVTRSADVASITGANFSSWYRQDEGTVFASAGVQDFTQTNFPRLFSIDRGDIGGNFIAAVRGNTTRRLDYSVFADGIGQAVGLNNGIAPAANTTVNGAWVYKANDFIGAVNGVLTNSDTSGSVPTLLTTFGVGMQGNATLHYNGTIKRLTYWPQRLSNSTLQAITQ